MKPHPVKNFLPFILAIFLVGCVTGEWVIQKNGQVVSEVELNMDKLRCEREAAVIYPYAPESVSIPSGYSSGSSTTCVPVGHTIRCDTSGGTTPASQVLTYDGNADSRKEFQEKCMAALGYQRIEIKKSKTNTVRPIVAAHTSPQLAQHVDTQSEVQAIIDAGPSSNVTEDRFFRIKVPKEIFNRDEVPVEISAFRPFNNGERLYLVVNGSITATLTPYDSRTQVNLAIRVKMPQDGFLKAVLVNASGQMHVVTRYVYVKAGEYRNQTKAPLGIVAPRIRATNAYGYVEIKSRINHSQNSYRYIRTISYLVDGTKVAEVGLTPESSRNPYVAIKIQGSAQQVEVQTNDSNGKSNNFYALSY